MDRSSQPAILGVGFSVPGRVVTNDDPIFNYLRETNTSGKNLFQGYKERRFLEPGEKIETLMDRACRQALDHAGLMAEQIDCLLGYSTVSNASTPNDLGHIHRMLGMRSDARVLAVNTEFTNFIDALEIAHDGIRLGRYRAALIALGSNWSRFLDYRTAPALSVGDGAGAVALGPATDPAQFRVIDSVAMVDTEYLGSMTMAPDPIPGEGQRFTHPYFRIWANGAEGFTKFAIPSVPECVNSLLKRHGLVGADITLATHQASSVMMDQWQTDIQPRFYASTLENFGNTTLAALPITLAAHYDKIPTDWVVLCGVGHYFHTTALLLGRKTSQ